MNVVCNTSPLLVLAEIQRLGLLNQLYARLVIPRAVLDEIGAKADEAAPQIQAFVATIPVTVQRATPQTLPALRPELDRLRAAGLWLAEAFYQRLCQVEER